jgi:hypothetical protein
MQWCKNEPQFVRNLLLDARSDHGEEITLLALSVVANESSLPQVSAAASRAMRWVHGQDGER